MDEIVRRLNYRTSGKIAYSADEIPTIAPKEAVAEFMKGDEEPYFKLQRIDYPIKANGVTYQESFFDSFLKNLKNAPFPGAKDGHEMQWGKRGNTDFVLVGGLVESKGDGKGSVYLKNYIPPMGALSSNETFIRENKAGMVHFSLVSYVKEERIETKDGYEINIIESLYGERNDAVDRGTGAMQQVTNAAVGGDDKANTQRGKKNMKQEFMEMLANLKSEKVTLQEIAKAMNAEDQLVTDEHVAALAVVNSLKTLEVTDPVKTITDLRETVAANAEAVRNAKLDTEFGASTKDDPNPLREYAGERLANATYADLMKGIEDVKQSPIAKKLAGDMADVVKNVGTVEQRKQSEPPVKKSRVDKL